MLFPSSLLRLISLVVILAAFPGIAAPAQTITGSFPRSLSSVPLDGRILLLLSNDPSREPRMQIDRTMLSQQVFGVTVDGLNPSQSVTIGDQAQGYPYASLRDVPPGNYTAQAVLNVYQTFHRADGKTIKLAPDRGGGPTLEPRTGQPNLDSACGAHWTGFPAGLRVVRQYDSSDSTGARYKVHPSHQDSVPVVNEVLGCSGLSFRRCARPGRFRPAP
jgi:hypothetical protein